MNYLPRGTLILAKIHRTGNTLDKKWKMFTRTFERSTESYYCEDNMGDFFKIGLGDIIKVISLPPKIKIQKLTIGSDPELCLVDPASRERVDACEMISDRSRDSYFGLDGNTATAELRPGWATGPLKHFNKIKNILKKYRNDLKNAYSIEFYASTTTPNPLGGHIHIGHPLIFTSSRYIEKTDYMIERGLIEMDYPEEYKDKTLSTYLSTYLSHQDEFSKYLADTRSEKIKTLVSALDTFVSLPLLFVEVPQAGKSRRLSYGDLSQYRDEPYGIEYRTPPSWIATPQLSRAVLSTAFTVAQAALEKEITIPPITYFEQKYREFNKEALYPELSRLNEIIRQTPLYRKYAKEINYLMTAAINNKPLLDAEIKTAWGIPFTENPSQPKNTIKDLIESIIKKLGRTTDKVLVAAIVGNLSDPCVEDISKRLNHALTLSLPAKYKRWSNKRVYLYGKAEPGTIEIITCDSTINYKRLAHLRSLILSMLENTQHPQTVTIKTKLIEQPNWHFRNNDLQGASTFQVKLKLGMSLELRQAPGYLAEKILIACLMFISPELYKSWGYSKKTYKHITSPIRTKPILQAMNTLCAA